MYLSSDNKYTEIFLESIMIRTRTMLKEFTEKLGEQFLKISRINIVNMAMAREAGAKVLLAGDIDRGGLYASFLGTWLTFTPEERRLLAGFLVTGISVGVGVPASWTYISESSETKNRGRNIGISQMAWGIGPLIILLLGWFLAPPTNNAEAPAPDTPKSREAAGERSLPSRAGRISARAPTFST